MNKYYLHNGTENIGPFNIEELKQQNITRNTQVWFEGMEDWKEAGTIEELKILFPVLPPPLKKDNTENKTSEQPIQKEEKDYSKLFKILKRLAIAVLIALIILFVLNIIDKQSSTSTYQESVMTIQEIEGHSPLNYLQADGTYNTNFIGDKVKINGVITNTATVTTYKDVTVRVNFYSKTNTLIGSEDYTLYEFYPPNSKQEFKLKVKAYSNVSTLGWEVINASVK
ncbi:DUF4339 domain-containing protein [Flavobacterium lacisediminis]|uniref:DUF4339 domain-containing protein n=1 Tax=Flavobacterium lacisediminis TaxID=2989705 RepID=A0ABT3EM65_9FLAO|nr:DUF4339 domain-containing protein [Flavobacterium lacisediminis]MCW1149165.1 DUF4339 domain-containing protein [Flavobacterium lacisediminis]